MRLTRLEKSENPIVTESGECLYEMMGAAESLGSARKQSLAFSIIPPGKHSASHFHKVSEETLYILEGKGTLIVNGEVIEVEAGDACMLKPGEIHSLYNKSKKLDLRLLAITAPPWTASDSYPAETDNHLVDKGG